MKKAFFTLCFLTSLISYGQRTRVEASLGGSLNKGNFNAYSVNTQLNVGQDSTKITWNFNPNFLYSRISSMGKWKENQRETYLVFSSSYRKDSHRLISFLEAENSYLKKIVFRGSFGIGYGNEIVSRKKFSLLVSEAIVPEIYFSDFFIDRNLTSLRLSTRIKITYLGKVRISSISLIQPAIWNDHNVPSRNNINARFINSIDFPIFKSFSLGMQMNANLSGFSAYVDNSVKLVDYNFSAVLKYRN